MELKMFKSSKHITTKEKSPGNHLNYGSGLFQQDFFAQFKSEAISQSFFEEDADINESLFSPLDGDLPYEKQNKLRKKLVSNKTNIPYGYDLLTIDKWVLRRYWDSYYAQYFYDNYGLHLHDRPLDWETFKDKYAVHYNLFKYELQVPFSGIRGREKKLPEQEKEESPAVIDRANAALPSTDTIVGDEAIEPVSEPITPTPTEGERANADLAEPAQESLKEVVIEQAKELSVEERRKIFSAVNKNISSTRLDKWIKKALDQGWKKDDPIPNIRSIQLQHVKELDGKPVDLLYVTANTYSDAYWFTKKHNYNGYWYFVDPISGQREGMIQKHGAIEKYNNDHYTFSEELIDDLYQVSGDDSLRNAALKQGYLGDAFILLVKDVQKKLLAPGYKFFGMYTPETKAKVNEKLAQIKLEQQQKEKKQMDLAAIKAVAVHYYISVRNHEEALNQISGKSADTAFLKLVMAAYRKIYHRNMLKDFTGEGFFSEKQNKDADVILLEAATIKEEVEVYTGLPNYWFGGTQEEEAPIVDLLKRENLSKEDLELLRNDPVFVKINLKSYLSADDYFEVRKNIGPLTGESQRDIVKERILDLNQWYNDFEEDILNAMLELSPEDRQILFQEMSNTGKLDFLDGIFGGKKDLKAISITSTGQAVPDVEAYRERLRIASKGEGILDFTDEAGITKTAELIAEKKKALLKLIGEKKKALAELTGKKKKAPIGDQPQIVLRFDEILRSALNKEIATLEQELKELAQISNDKAILPLLEGEIQPTEIADFLRTTGDNPKEEARQRILGASSDDYNTIFESYEGMLDSLNPQEFKNWMYNVQLFEVMTKVADQLTREERVEYTESNDEGSIVLTKSGEKRKQAIVNGFITGDRVILAQCKIISALGINDKEHIIFKAILDLTDDQDKVHFKNKDRTRFNEHEFTSFLKNKLDDKEKAIVDNILAGQGLPASTVNYALEGVGTNLEVLKLYFKYLPDTEKGTLRLGFYLSKTAKQANTSDEIKAKQDYESLYKKLRRDTTWGIPELEFEEYQNIIDEGLGEPSTWNDETPEQRKQIAQVLYLRVKEKANARNVFLNGDMVTGTGHIEDKYYAEFMRLYDQAEPDGFSKKEVDILKSAANKYDISHEGFLANVDRVTNIAATVASIIAAVIATALTEGAAAPWLVSLIASASSASAGIVAKSLGGQLTTSQAGEDLFAEMISLGVGTKLKLIKGAKQGLTASQVLRGSANEITEQSVKQSQKDIFQKMIEEIIDQQIEGAATEGVLTAKDIALLEQTTYDIIKQHQDAWLSPQNLAVNFVPVGSLLELAQGGSTQKTGMKISKNKEDLQKTEAKQELPAKQQDIEPEDKPDAGKEKSDMDDKPPKDQAVSALTAGKELEINKTPVPDQNIEAAKSKQPDTRAADQFTNLSGETKVIYSELFSLGLKHQIDGNTITFFGSKGEVIATIIDDKFLPKKWTEFNTGLEKDGIKTEVVAILESGHILLKINGEYAFNLGFNKNTLNPDASNKDSSIKIEEKVKIAKEEIKATTTQTEIYKKELSKESSAKEVKNIKQEETKVTPTQAEIDKAGEILNERLQDKDKSKVILNAVSTEKDLMEVISLSKTEPELLKKLIDLWDAWQKPHKKPIKSTTFSEYVKNNKKQGLFKLYRETEKKILQEKARNIVNEFEKTDDLVKSGFNKDKLADIVFNAMEYKQSEGKSILESLLKAQKIVNSHAQIDDLTKLGFKTSDLSLIAFNALNYGQLSPVKTLDYLFETAHSHKMVLSAESYKNKYEYLDRIANQLKSANIKIFLGAELTLSFIVKKKLLGAIDGFEVREPGRRTDIQTPFTRYELKNWTTGAFKNEDYFSSFVNQIITDVIKSKNESVFFEQLRNNHYVFSSRIGEGISGSDIAKAVIEKIYLLRAEQKLSPDAKELLDLVIPELENKLKESITIFKIE